VVKPHVLSDIGEALGLSHAIQWVHELQLPNVDFELDAKRVVDYFNNGKYMSYNFQMLILSWMPRGL
jgi:hypothetical protein